MSEISNDTPGADLASPGMVAVSLPLPVQFDLLELAHDAIVVRDMEGHILYWTRGAERLYGWNRQEVLGARKQSLLHTQYPVSPEEVAAHLREAGEWEGTLFHQCKDGSRVVITFPLRDDPLAPLPGERPFGEVPTDGSAVVDLPFSDPNPS